MKTKLVFVTLTLFIFSLLAACAPAAEPTATAPTSVAGEFLTIDYADAANLRSQLAYGILQLNGTPNAVSAEQAKILIPLWQAVISLSGDETTASEELTAVQDQITLALTTEQLKAIEAMQITNADLNSFYAQYGISLPTPVPGVTKVPGSGGKTEEEKAAAQATAAASGITSTGTGTGQVAKTLLFEKTIEYLNGVGQ